MQPGQEESGGEPQSSWLLPYALGRKREVCSIPLCSIWPEFSERIFLPLLQSVSFLALKSSCSLLWKADQERDERTGWVQEEVGGRGDDSCISLADLEPD